MTMGAGKTFTAATLSYRLLAHADACRVLFLVDRNNLGKQTLKEFQTYRPPGAGRLFTELYNVQRLGPAGLDRDAKVVIATIQRVYAQLTGTALDEADEEGSAFEADAGGTPKPVAYNPAMPPETFDFVIVDECHRSIYGRWVITHPCFGRSDQAVTVCRMVLKTLVPGLRRAVSTTLRMSASPSAAHMAR